MINELNEMMSDMESEFACAIAENNKFLNGNNSAGTRLRKHMQNIKSLAQGIRLEVQNQKNAVTA